MLHQQIDQKISEKEAELLCVTDSVTRFSEQPSVNTLSAFLSNLKVNPAASYFSLSGI